ASCAAFPACCAASRVVCCACFAAWSACFCASSACFCASDLPHAVATPNASTRLAMLMTLIVPELLPSFSTLKPCATEQCPFTVFTNRLHLCANLPGPPSVFDRGDSEEGN